jgi:hypothetical protein
MTHPKCRDCYFRFAKGWLAAILLLLASGPILAADLFTQRVAPLLQQRCVPCHNPEKTRGSLDVTSRESLLKGGENGPAVLPGDAAKSLLVKMISGAKPRMPRQAAPLSPEEVATLRRWIDDGAQWPPTVTVSVANSKPNVGPDWWSLRPLSRPPVPPVRDAASIMTPIDAFIRATLQAKGLRPAPPADRRTLIRRATFDLLGLPPAPEAIDAFVNDPDPKAYAKLIDRLLANPHYGERWGRHWLDVVHYGDTHGYDKDKRRDQAWPYRDYVIHAFNADKPYDRFIREQLAGDVLWPDEPDAVIATGFIAAGPWDFVGQVELREGTVDKEKTRLLDRDDMVANTMSTFTSMTVHCARCHDHKFDPIPQQDYYRLQAVFAGVERADRPYGGRQAMGPRPALEKRLQELSVHRASLVKKVEAAAGPDLVRLDQDIKALKEQLSALAPPNQGKPSPSNGYHSAISATPDVIKWVQVDLGRSLPIDRIRLFPARPVDFPDTPGFGFPVRFRIELAEDPSFINAQTIANHSATDFPNPGDNPVIFTLNGAKARYVRVTAQRLWLRANDYAFALAEMQVETGGKNIALGKPVSALDSIEGGLWSAKYLVDNCDSRHVLPDLGDRAAVARFERRHELQNHLMQAQRNLQTLTDLRMDSAIKAELARIAAESATVTRQLQALAAGPMVYAVVGHAPRPIYVLIRGDVEHHGAQVEGGALRCVAELSARFATVGPNPEGRRRAALADWISDRRNVLTWRSIANRIWHYHFGRGLVDTPNDFGYNGGRPTHPDLLDWLAVDFLEKGQSIKQLHRTIMLSAAYRQSSEYDAAAARRDADNRFLWHMNRRRLDAEAIRDSILAVSGKLDSRMGGPGFELFRFKDDHSPVYDHGDLDRINSPACWRRTVYRFTVRSFANPFLECLDCADPNINTPVRNTTLTALQALALLNDPFLLKQSEYFADRLRQLTGDLSGQVETAYALALGRPAIAGEREAVVEYARKHGLVNACRLVFNMNEFIFID